MNNTLKAFTILFVSIIVGVALLMYSLGLGTVSANVNDFVVDSEQNNKVVATIEVKNTKKSTVVVYVDLCFYTITGRNAGTETIMVQLGSKQKLVKEYEFVLSDDYDLTYGKIVVGGVRYMEVLKGG